MCMQLCDVDIELWWYLIGIITVCYVSVDDLHVLQETIMGIFTRQVFHNCGALSFNASGLMDKKNLRATEW